MAVASTLCLCVLQIVVFSSFLKSETSFQDKFEEELFIKPLARGFISSDFRFTTTLNVTRGETDNKTYEHFRLFPKSLTEILNRYQVRELHLTFTQGIWKPGVWGYPAIDAPSGVELWAWFHNGTSGVDTAWNGLVNALSGLFCASLNFIDGTNTIIPKVSFRPRGVASDGYATDSRYLRYATLPQEVVCTENLTPWKKLLPCGAVSGLAMLFNARQLFDGHFYSMGVHFRPICQNPLCASTAVELTQTLLVVSELALEHGAKQDWSFKKLFDMMLFSHCPIATASSVYVDLSRNDTGETFLLNPFPSRITKNSEGVRIAVYDVAQLTATQKAPLNIVASYARPAFFGHIPAVHLTANRYVRGYGQESGVIQCVVRNNHPTKPLRIVYLEQIPSFTTVYAHTFTITINGKLIEPEFLYIAERSKKSQAFHLEAIVTLPPKSVTEFNIDFDKPFLKWNAYPPDANHGFYIGPAVISTNLHSSQNYSYIPQTVSGIHPENRPSPHKTTGYFITLHTNVLLLSVPTPDFSMPYNVICLVCTVIALAFGPLHNITTKRFVAADPNAPKGIIGKISGFFKRLKSSFSKS